MGIKSKLLVVSTLVVSTGANAALVSRLSGQAYYDTVNNLTWLADANYSFTTGYDTNGAMNWADANIWAASLDIDGVTGWRLPTTVDVGSDGETAPDINQGVDAGYNISTQSEMSNLFYNVLNNNAWVDISGVDNACAGVAPDFCLTNTGPFINVQTNTYWSGTENIANTANAWEFSFIDGYQDTFDKNFATQYSWAVRTGDVSAVPVPAAVWLFASGLLGLISVARSKC